MSRRLYWIELATIGVADKTQQSRRVWLVLILAGFAARLYLWWVTTGTNDPVLWYEFGTSVSSTGLIATYQKIQLFNHPPLMGLWAMQSYRWSSDLWTFAHYLKLPGLLGEALTLWALWRFAGPVAAGAYALLPAAILVSGFHGNTDCLYAALVLVAVIAFDRQRYFVAGLLLAAALNVKLIPLLLVPLVFIGLPNRRALLLLTAGLSIGAVPFIGPALEAGPEMYRNMLQYNSNADNWGIPLLLRPSGRSLDPEFSPTMLDTYLEAGRYVILTGVVLVGLLSRFRGKRPMAEQAALGAALFLLLTPGFGVQYVVFAAPLLCLVDLSAALLWGWASGVFIASVYWHFRTPDAHFTAMQNADYPMKTWVVGLVAWATLWYFVWRHRPFGGARRVALTGDKVGVAAESS